MKILKFVWSMIQSVIEASHAANLARNGKIEEAKAAYK